MQSSLVLSIDLDNLGAKKKYHQKNKGRVEMCDDMAPPLTTVQLYIGDTNKNNGKIFMIQKQALDKSQLCITV